MDDANFIDGHIVDMIGYWIKVTSTEIKAIMGLFEYGQKTIMIHPKASILDR